jgi:predicted SprT family Zn-dependent metalloprotease
MITTVQFKTLDDLYGFYNKALFEGRLADCIVNMSRHAGSYGFFAAKRWKAEDEKGKKQLAHEISLNPDYLDRPFEEWHATLVHEMVHLWQEDSGSPSRAAYHNKEWARKMEQIGLIPSSTGRPGGKKTGQAMTHYIDRNGLFMKAFRTLSQKSLKELRLKYLPAYPHPEPAGKKKGREEGGPREGGEGGGNGGESREGEAGAKEETEKYTSKKKYACPCGNNVWGKPGLKILCGECCGEFEEA